jgi:hypothetical protein
MRLAQELFDAITELAKREQRTRHNMVRVLLKEALAMRAGEYETEFNRG